MPRITPTTLTSPNQPTQTINVLLTSFAGLGLPRTLSLPVQASTTISDVVQTIMARLPPINHPLLITTTSNKQLLLSDFAPVATLLSIPDNTFLPLRLSVRMCGGKGGFGSQLRAAGGRMSSRKNRQNQQQNVNGSNRNLDGRRLRTVDEAKKLAEYLAIRPEMEKKEREERRKRWEAVVQTAERREEEIKSGKTGSNGGRLDAEYVDSKELAEEKTREAVLRAMREGMEGLERTGSESSAEGEKGDSGEEDGVRASSASSEEVRKDQQESGRSFFGWDEDEDDDDDEHTTEPAVAPEAYAGKGKGRST